MAVLRVIGIVYFICVAVSNAGTCSDEDVTLCQMIVKEKPDMCDDPCMSGLCKRFCGQCPLICYSCHETGDVSNCSSVMQCNSSDEYCFTVQTFNDHFEETYKLGCASKHKCLQYSSIAHSRSVSVDAGCCNTDKCNNKPPSLLHILNTTSSTPTNGTVANRSLCDNLSDDICTRLMSLKPNMCTDDCIANKICPHICGKCYNCLSCDETDDTKNCNTTVECNNGKECFAMEVLTHELKPALRLGCMDNLTCQKFHTSHLTGIFGKRQSFTLQGKCCIGEKCNSNPSMMTATTASPTCSHIKQCPVGFHTFDGNCYRLGDRFMTKANGEEYCRKQCSQLAEFSTKQKLITFLRMSKTMFNVNSHTEFQAFLGISDINHSQNFPVWRWDISGIPMDHNMLVRPLDGNGFCMIGVYNQFADHSMVTGIRNVHCTHPFKPLCQIKLSS